MAGVENCTAFWNLSACSANTLGVTVVSTLPPTIQFLHNESLLPLNDSYNATNRSSIGRFRMRPRDIGLEVQIPIYVLIFLLSVVGNILVVVTLVQNKKMRTVTNVFLLNLAVSDLLLAVFCMPFTIVPMLLRNFIFGAAMCVLIRYLQGR